MPVIRPRTDPGTPRRARAPRRVLLLAVLAVALLAPADVALTADETVTVGPDSTNSFRPAHITITQGDTVTWTWATGSHNVVAKAGQAETFDSGYKGAGGTFSHRFTKTGRFDYLCELHSYGMVGSVTVEPPAGEPPPGDPPPDPPADTTPPAVSSLKARPARFCTRRSGPCRKPGTRFRFTLSEAARVVGRVTRVRGGRVLATVRADGVAGANSIRFSGAKLRPGKYRLTLVATDPARNKSAAARATFTVIRTARPAAKVGRAASRAVAHPTARAARTTASSPGAGSRTAATKAVTIRDFSFSPATVTVEAGDTVTWHNAGPSPHSATADDGSFDTGILSKGESGSHTFTRAGTFTYYCGPHPSMKGTIRVVAASADDPGGGRGGDRGEGDDTSDEGDVAGAGTGAGGTGGTGGDGESPGALPFTGFPIWLVAGLGLASLATGVAARRLAS